MERTIGLKVADGTFYPVLEDGFFGDKRLVLTTVRDDQPEVHIDLYQGATGAAIADTRYIGSLIIENIPPGPKGGPNIEVVIGSSREGSLNVSATDRNTGEEQSLSVSLGGIEDEGAYDVPDFDLQGLGSAEAAPGEPETPAEKGAPASTYRGAADRPAPREAERPRRSLAAVALIVILGVAALGVAAYFVFRALQGPGVPGLVAGASSVATQSAKAAEPAKVTEPAKAAEPAKAVEPTKATETAAQPEGERGVRYRVKWGDTLWDLSSSYYRDPWLYLRISKANNIKNPDRIYAGTTIFIPER